MMIKHINVTKKPSQDQIKMLNMASAFPVSEDDDYESGIDTMQYGTADCILYRATTNANRPDFITPPAGPSETIMNEINFMIQEI